MSRGRSAAVYAAASLLAIGIGATAALLRPAPTSGTSMKVRMDPGRVDAAVVREQLLEDLIVDARAAENVEHLRAFDVAMALVDGGEEYGWARERLLEPDVPAALVLAVARRASRRGQGPARAAVLLERFLAEGSAEAVAVVRARDEGQVRRDVVARCSFALYRDWVVAWGPGLAWAPVRTDDRWVLNLRPEEGGERALTMRLEGATSVSARDGEGPQITARGTD